MKMKISKSWRVLFTVIFALSLIITLAPAAAAQDQECNPTPTCGPLQVNIILPEEPFSVEYCTYFWVNASVAKPPDRTTVHQVQVGIQHTSGLEIIYGPDTSPFNLNTCEPVRDFWWYFHCKTPGAFPGGTQEAITVSAITPDVCQVTGDLNSSDQISVKQLPEACDTYLRAEIIECPSGPIAPSTTFGVKARIWNDSDHPICNAAACIDWKGICPPDVTCDCPQGSAHLVSGTTCYNNLNTILPGCSKEVGWTFHCDSPGWVKFTVLPSGLRGDWVPCDPCHECVPCEMCWQDCIVPVQPCEIVPGVCNVHQLMPPLCELEVEAPDKVCYDCDPNFTVTATVSELCGDTPIENCCIRLDILDGNAVLAPGESRTQCVGIVPPGGDVEVSWDLICTGIDENTGPECAAHEVTVVQVSTDCCDLEPVIKEIYQTGVYTEIVAPEDGLKVNKCQTFDVHQVITNCSGQEWDSVESTMCLHAASCVDYETYLVDVIPGEGCNPSEPYQVMAEFNGYDNCYTAPLDCICECCDVELVWHLVCKCVDNGDDCSCSDAEMETINVHVLARQADGTQYVDCDSVKVCQMWKAHLAAGIMIVEGVDDDDPQTNPEFQGQYPIEAISPCEYFTVIVPVVNYGQSAAYDVAVTLDVQGDAVTQTPLEQVISEIPCHSGAKLTWDFHCEEEGDVEISVASLTAYDTNTGLPVPDGPAPADDNIDLPCPITLKQIPVSVEIIQPLTCEDIEVHETFTIKAEVCNLSSEGETLSGVYAILHWIAAPCPGEGYCPPVPCGINPLTGEPMWGMMPAPGQALKVPLEILLPGECAEATWQMECCCPGDVEFWVEMVVEGSPIMSKDSESETVHQWEPGDLHCRILSPVLQPCDADNLIIVDGSFPNFDGRDHCYLSGPYIATSQDFALTVDVCNSAEYPIVIDNYALTNDPCHGVNCDDCGIGTFSASDPSIQMPWRLEPGECITVSWDLHCDSSGETPINLYFSGYGDLDDECPQCWPVETSCCIEVHQYPAAHLEVEVTEAPPTPIMVSSTFEVSAVITNTGEADAWESYATLSVFPEGSVRVVEGGYTKPLGNLIGHGVNESVEVTWLLHCKQACESTITITAGGLDEFGYHTKQRYSDKCHSWILDLEPDSGLPINPKFIEPDSVTVKQLPGTGLDLSITKEVDSLQPEVGDNVTYTIVVYNAGPGDATNVYVNESLPAGLTNWIALTTTQGVYDPNTGNWDVGNMAPNTYATLVLQAEVAESGLTTNTATVAADQPDGIPGNNTASATIDAGGNFDIALSTGWNLISSPYYIYQADRDIATRMSGLTGLDVVWAYDACGGGWANYATTGPAGTLTEFKDGPGYWVKMSEPGTLSIIGTVLPVTDPPTAPPSYPVCPGWNLIGLRDNQPRPVQAVGEGYLNGIDYAVIYGFKNGAYHLVTPTDLLEPGYGYWIAVITPGSIQG